MGHGFFHRHSPARFDGCPEPGNLVSGYFFAAGDFFFKRRAFAKVCNGYSSFAIVFDMVLQM